MILGDDTYPPWEQGVRQGGLMNIEVMSNNLLEYKEILDKNNVRFVLFFGTLLGVIRTQSFISYDTDIDVIVFWDDYLNWLKAKAELRERGFKVIDDRPIHDEHVIRDGEKIEMWWTGEVRDQYVYNNAVRFDKELLFPLTTINFLGKDFLIPSKSIILLEMIYGKDWMIPNEHTKGCSYEAK
jgi:lipopolysaccharide cholinephosphotransferase